ncbi:Uncharacterized protein C11G11.07 [Taphrina deformans PYCC 5710]|uniref:Uncharacterized protein C11G11.07 n=1 Tax=Taphrina deformans (strain PYCC 5710 / ATCC 11124 / CBS 356.35 / IMI 108563 / JCM 9778 / NBRC 8474) TaxID=1097556 RepID=R4X797_TAPDE|nr:Uncharacterized protein C11G11.07 [Taphrina deformans PYCC 5710]|eukprot:CCG80943.2 Uncharacterized protein C11G11.07 [Taphrina deformans PYCC 5710]
MSSSTGYEPLLDALSSLYSNSERSQKEAANAYLESFQKSSEAWQTAHDILSSESILIEAKLFAAQTLKTKIQYDFHQLPPEALGSLRDSLVGLVHRYAGGPRPILIALCVALATLALQMSEWTTVLQDMTSTLSGDAKSWNALLQFISVLPEEISESRKMSLTEQQMEASIERLLTRNAEQVLRLLTAYVQQIGSAENINPLLFTCLSSWLRETPITQLMQSPLVDLTFQALALDNLFESSVDLLCNIFRESNEVNDPDMVKVIEILYPKLMTLRPKIQETKNELDTFRGYARLFSEAGEAWVILIARLPAQFRPLVETIAESAGIDEDLEIVKFTFNFWYDLKQALTSPRYEQAKQEFAPIYLGLVDIMIHHLHYPSGADVNDVDLFDGDRDAEDKFRDFRHDMGDVLKDCCNVVGGSVCLGKAFDKIQSLMQRSKTEQVKWQDIEAPLFSMRAMAREISSEESAVLPHIMNTLLSLPEHPKIRYAATLVLGRYTEWTAQHPDYLLPQLNYITSGFKDANVDVISAAAQALKHFCRDCSKLLVDNIEQLYGFYEQVLPSLDFDSAVETTEGLAHVILAQPTEKLYLALKSFTDPISARIATVSQTFSEDEKIQRKLADDIELLTVFAFTVSPYIPENTEHPCVKVYAEIWPVLSNALDTFGQVRSISERICSCMRTILNNYRQNALPLLPAFAEKLSICFDRYRYGCFLWVSGACVRQFANKDDNTPETVGAVWQFVESQSVAMFKYLSTTEPKQISDVVEDFFRLMMDALHGNAQMFLGSMYLQTILQASMASLVIEQIDALTCVLRFLRDLTAWGLSTSPAAGQDITPEVKSSLQNLLSTYGDQLTGLIFTGQVYSFPRDCIGDASGVILTLLEMQPDSALPWIENAFSRLPAETVGEPERIKFLDGMRQSCHAKDFKRSRSQLQDLTTLYRRRMLAKRTDVLSAEDNAYQFGR